MNTTAIAVSLALMVYSELVLVFLFVATLRRAGRHPSGAQRAYLDFILLTAAVIAADFVSRLDGSTGALFTACRAGNFLLFLLNPVMGVLWYRYVCGQIPVPDRARRAGLWIQIFLCGFNGFAVACTPFTGWLYWFDAQNRYHRGPLFFFMSATLMCLLFCTEMILIRYRDGSERRHFLALLFFPLIPMICTFLQVAAYGVATGLHGTVFSLLIVSYYVQDRSLDIDYLTGLYNRRKLDICLRQKIAAARTGPGFSAIYLDINHFKSINDTFGHPAGDAILVEAAQLLRSVLRAGTFLSRFGGDEFCVVLGVTDPAALERIVGRIRRGAELYSKTEGRSYTLSFSIGAAVYTDRTLTPEAYEKQLDALMYADKEAYYAAAGCSRTAVRGPAARRSADRGAPRR